MSMENPNRHSAPKASQVEKTQRAPTYAEDVGDGGAFVYYNDGSKEWVDMRTWNDEAERDGGPWMKELIAQGQKRAKGESGA